MRRNLCSIVAAIPALLVMACALGPDYHRPETKVPAAFRFEPTATTESFADQGWWQVYQDPTLQSLIREALDNNLDVRIAAARIEQARAVLGSTRLQQLPQIAVSADAQRARTSVDQRVPGVPAITNVFSADGSLSYELDFWGKYRRATESARAGLLASAYAKQDVMAGLVSGVATAYFTLLTLDEQLAITQRTVGTRQKFVDLTQAQHERGTVSGLDVATAQAQLAIAQANIPDLQRQIGIAEDQLSVLLDRNPDQIVRTESSQLRRMIEPAIPPVPPAGLPSSLLERRPDLRAAEQNLVAANANVGVALARYRVGSASYFDVINADRDLFTAELSLSAAHLNTLLSLVQLYRAVGGGWQTEQSGKSAPDPTPDTTGLTPDSPSASAHAP